MEEIMLSQDEFDVWKREIKHQFHIKNYHAFPLLFTDEANVSSTGNWSFDDMLILNNQRMRKAEQDRAEMMDQIKKAQDTIDTSSQKIINLEHTVNSLNNTVNSLNEQVGCLVNMLKRRYESCGEISGQVENEPRGGGNTRIRLNVEEENATQGVPVPNVDPVVEVCKPFCYNRISIKTIYMNSFYFNSF